jgi:hypothetical protein
MNKLIKVFGRLLEIMFAPLFLTSNTGRTVEKWIYVIVGNTGDTQLNELPIKAINGVGLNYDVKDVTAMQDQIKNALADKPDAPIKLTVIFDTSAAQAAPTSGQAHVLSGSHTVLAALCGDGKPHTLMVAYGIRHEYTTNEPVFGLQRATASNSGYSCSKYNVNADGTAEVEFFVMGSIAPAWGAALLTVGS